MNKFLVKYFIESMFCLPIIRRLDEAVDYISREYKYNLEIVILNEDTFRKQDNYEIWKNLIRDTLRSALISWTAIHLKSKIEKTYPGETEYMDDFYSLHITFDYEYRLIRISTEENCNKLLTEIMTDPIKYYFEV
jgi:hypothetical protein